MLQQIRERGPLKPTADQTTAPGANAWATGRSRPSGASASSSLSSAHEQILSKRLAVNGDGGQDDDDGAAGEINFVNRSGASSSSASTPIRRATITQSNLERSPAWRNALVSNINHARTKLNENYRNPDVKAHIDASLQGVRDAAKALKNFLPKPTIAPKPGALPGAGPETKYGSAAGQGTPGKGPVAFTAEMLQDEKSRSKKKAEEKHRRAAEKEQLVDRYKNAVNELFKGTGVKITHWGQLEDPKYLSPVANLPEIGSAGDTDKLINTLLANGAELTEEEEKEGDDDEWGVDEDN